MPEIGIELSKTNTSNMTNFHKLTLVMAGAITSINIFAQVTVGMSEAPTKTALLQLKSQSADASNITSMKGGLLLPRVKLLKINTLQPFVDPTDTDYSEEKKMSTGLIVYNVNKSTEDGIYPGVYCWDGEKWNLTEFSSQSNSDTSNGNSTSGAVQLNLNQSNFVTLSGTQSYGLLMENQNITLNPKYVTGFYPGGSVSGLTTSIITSTDGHNGNTEAMLLEAPGVGKANIFKMNMQFVMGNNPPSETRYFDVKIESAATGALIYQNSIVVPGKLNTGHVAYFQVLFPTIADTASISAGYRIIFGLDTAASTGLSNNISVKINDVLRVNF